MSDERIIRRREINLRGSLLAVTSMRIDGRPIVRYETEDGSLLCDATPDQVQQINATLTHYSEAGEGASLIDLFTAAGMEFTQAS